MDENERTETGTPAPDLLRAATRRAWVTPAITAVLVACFAGSWLLGVDPLSPTAEQLYGAGAGFGPALVEGQWWRLLTASLLHGGLLHIGFNLWAFWGAGQFAERIYGNLGFLALYVLGALGCSLLSAAVHPLTVSVGASGAIFGVYGALLLFAFTHRGVFPPELLRKQRNSLLGFLGYNVVFAFTQPNIDLAGHAGGLLTGIASGWLLRRDLRRPAASIRRRVAGAAGMAALLALGALGVRARVERLPAVRAHRLADAGAAAFRAKDYRGAADRYTEALAIERDARWLYSRGLANIALERGEDAVADLRASREVRDSPAARLMLCRAGLVLAASDEARIAAAVEDCSPAIERDSKPPDALQARGLLLLSLGRLDEAERDCSELWSTPEVDLVPGRFCAEVARRRGETATALERAGRVLARQPDHVGTLWFRALAESDAGDLAAEAADLERVLRLEPDNASALNSRAWLRVERGDFAGGLGDAGRSLAVRPDDPSTLGTRCFALAGLGDSSAARRDCARAVELAPASLIDRGMLAFLDGDRAGAVRLWEEAGRKRAADARVLRPWIAKARGR